MALIGRRSIDLARRPGPWLAAFGVAAGLVTVAVARRDPGAPFSHDATRDLVLELSVAGSLILAGLVFGARRPGNRCAALLAIAGVAWLLPEWSGPRGGVPLVFTLGLVGFAGCAPLIAHAALAYPSGRVGGTAARGALAIAYLAMLGALGLVSASLLDPAAQGCLGCPSNLVLVHADAGVYEAVLRSGLWIGLGSAVALSAVITWRAVRAPLVISVPVLAPAVIYLGLVAWDLARDIPANVLGGDPVAVGLRRAEALALIALAGGVIWGAQRTRRTRASIAALLVELTRSAEPGAVRDALAHALEDDALRLAYRREGAYVDAHGDPTDATPDRGQTATPLRLQGREVAVLVHDARLTRDRGVIGEVVAAARLAIEHERMHALLHAQLDALRASRVRIVKAGDRARRGLERDLHDGAQQRLVGLALLIRVLRAPGAAPALETRLDEAEAELRATLAELRELAHGIFPSVLTDDGLAAAIETLAETSSTRIEIRALPHDRLDPAVESIAYFIIAEPLRRAHATRATVAASCIDGRLIVELGSDRDPGGQLTDLEDRVGALGGRVEVHRMPDGLRLRAELPCA